MGDNRFKEILKQYWGHDSFHPLQEEIILSVTSGKDTLALMPTGGGKSITFQVPALAMDGICIVISPLIALMKDQVDRLKRNGIKAVVLHSGMTTEEIDIALDNCIYGDYKFLYVSPERISSRLFQIRVQMMNVCLIAVDEAHCISQWGYDFRPSYLKIAELRDILPENVPILALTASATPTVVDDIMSKLRFKEQNVLKTSFERKNISYIVHHVEDKLTYLVNTLSQFQGVGIIYTRSRKKCKEIAELLQSKNISADYYHAGLSQEIRDRKQDDWTKDRVRIMVCTNAFGIGIDKP
ncbi:MAG: ATP-dependent DNA helicase RecQ, partial [Bacteroidales bacterium]|nr:ATP-dependent DNA helicase RecQ [Bacteroidales bacterium]